jgi:hypothetical protein
MTFWKKDRTVVEETNGGGGEEEAGGCCPLPGLLATIDSDYLMGSCGTAKTGGSRKGKPPIGQALSDCKRFDGDPPIP